MMDQLTTNAEALRLFFTEDVYLVKEEELMLNDQVVEEQQAEILAVSVEVPAGQVTFSYLGKNQRQILILVNDADNQVSTEQGRELLRKLVKAIELTANDFALVNYASYTSASFAALSSYFSSKVMFIFGVSPLQLGLGDFPKNSLVKHGSTHLIFSSDLHSLDGDQQGKKTLWASLKQLTF